MKRILFILSVSLVACAPVASSSVASLPIRAGQLWQYTVTSEGQPPVIGTISVKAVIFTIPIDTPKNDATALVAGDISRGALLLYFPNSRTMKLTFYSDLNRETGGCKFVFADKNQKVATSDHYVGWKMSEVMGKCEIQLIN